MGLTMSERNALTNEVSKRYQKSERKEKTLILNEFIQTTGYSRKYALHKLANWRKTTTVQIDRETVKVIACIRKRRKGGGRKPLYSGEFVDVLQNVWVFFWFRCVGLKSADTCPLYT
jgi:hypothetical protein